MIAIKSQKILGIICVVSTVTLFSIHDMAVKWLSTDFPLHQITFVRSIIGIIITLAIFVPLEGQYKKLVAGNMPLLIVRGSIMVFTNVLIFCALATLPMTTAMAIFFVGPLITTVLSIPFLGEKIGKHRISAVLVGLLGCLLIMRPGGDSFQFAALFPLGAAFFYSLMVIMTRKLGATESASTMVFYLQLIFLIFSLSMYIFFGDGEYGNDENLAIDFVFRAWIWPDFHSLLFLLLIGLTFGAAGYLVSQAYRVAEASFLAPFEYVSIPMAVLWSYFIWGELPDSIATIGIVLIVSAGLYTAYREARNKPNDR